MYTIEYFIKKFETIPEEEWFVGDYTNPVNSKQRCVFGHCGCNKKGMFMPNDETNALVNLTDYKEKLTLINDGKIDKYLQPTPKQRVLACLNDLLKSKNTIPE